MQITVPLVLLAMLAGSSLAAPAGSRPFRGSTGYGSTSGTRSSSSGSRPPVTDSRPTTAGPHPPGLAQHQAAVDADPSLPSISPAAGKHPPGLAQHQDAVNGGASASRLPSVASGGPAAALATPSAAATSGGLMEWYDTHGSKVNGGVAALAGTLAITGAAEAYKASKLKDETEKIKNQQQDSEDKEKEQEAEQKGKDEKEQKAKGASEQAPAKTEAQQDQHAKRSDETALSRRAMPFRANSMPNLPSGHSTLVRPNTLVSSSGRSTYTPQNSRPNSPVGGPTASRPSLSISRPQNSRPISTVGSPQTSRPGSSTDSPQVSRPSSSAGSPLVPPQSLVEHHVATLAAAPVVEAASAGPNKAEQEKLAKTKNGAIDKGVGTLGATLGLIGGTFALYNAGQSENDAEKEKVVAEKDQKKQAEEEQEKVNAAKVEEDANKAKSQEDKSKSERRSPFAYTPFAHNPFASTDNQDDFRHQYMSQVVKRSVASTRRSQDADLLGELSSGAVGLPKQRHDNSKLYIGR